MAHFWAFDMRWRINHKILNTLEVNYVKLIMKEFSVRMFINDVTQRRDFLDPLPPSDTFFFFFCMEVSVSDPLSWLIVKLHVYPQNIFYRICLECSIEDFDKSAR